MAAPKLSETTTERAILGRRDAFHVPGILVSSDELIDPGEKLVFTNEELTLVRETRSINERHHAIADPFLADGIPPGCLFWAVLVPGTMTNLVHSFETTITVQPEDDYDDQCKGCYE